MRVVDTTVELTNTDAVHETQSRIIVLLKLHVPRVAAPFFRCAKVESEAVGRVVTIQSRRIALLKPGFTGQTPPARQARIEVAKIYPDQGVVQIRLRVAVGHDDADVGLVQHIERRASDEKIRGIGILELVLPDIEHAEIPVADSPRQLGADIERHRPSRRT